MRRRPRTPRRPSARRADRPASWPARRSASSSSSRRSGMRGCQPPGARRCITAPGKVSGSRRFYLIIRGTAWNGGVLDLRKRLRERDRLSAGGRWIRRDMRPRLVVASRKFRFARDSPLERDGFELSVPRVTSGDSRRSWRHDGRRLRAQQVRFAPDSPVEGTGFEPSGPRLG
jgi:hypothetical protein